MKRAATLLDAESMGMIRLLGIVVIMVSLSGSAVFALDPMGPPLARVREGQFSVGADFSFSEMEFELSKGKWVTRDPDFDPPTGDPGDRKIKDFETIRLYGTIGYGLAKNWEAFIRLGAAKAEFGDSIWGAAGEDFDSNIDFAIGGGVRATFFEIPELNLQIGGLFQANWSNFDGKLDASIWPAPDFVEISLAEAQIAIGATYTWTNRVQVYGGPFVYYIRGDLEDIFTRFEYSWDIDEGPIFGGYLGTRLQVAQDFIFNIEYQYSADATAIGAGLVLLY